MKIGVMKIMIGCAKDMAREITVNVGISSQPMFKDEALRNALQMMAYDADELKGMLKCNDDIAKENRARYLHFTDEDNRGMQAVFAYTGVVYKYLSAGGMNEDELRYLQEHLWITSFLYGLLRPMDIIKNYRMEGNVVLPDNGVSMFDFWKPIITGVLIDSVKNDGGVLIDLASKEMRKLFDWRRVEKSVKVISPEFLVNKNGELKTIVVYAKMCRGAMMRFIVKNRITNEDDLLDFDFEGFRYSATESKPGKPVFILA